MKAVDQTLGWDPVNLRPVPSNEPVGGAFAIYDALFYEDPGTSKLVPRLGESLRTTDGGKTWVLKLRPNVKFSDGTSFDADAVRFNWQRIADPAKHALTAPTASVIQTMAVPDPLTLRVTLKAADPIWDHRVAENISWIASPTALKSEGTNYGRHPVGAGPFILKEYVVNDHEHFVRNPHYWEAGRPYLDELTIKTVADDNARYNTLKSGAANVDYQFDPTLISKTKQDGYPITTMSAGGGWSIELNNSKPPFNDPRVRRAVNLAVDRGQFNQSRRNGDSASLMSTVDAKGSPYYDPAITVPDHDLAAAQKLINEVVAETGKPVEFNLLVYTVQYIQQDAELLQAQMSQLKNVHINLQPLPPAEVIARTSGGNFQSFIASWPRWSTPSLDMATYFGSNGSENSMSYSNSKVDELLHQLATAKSQSTQVGLVHAVEQQLLKDLPMVWYSRYQSFTILDKKVRGWHVYYDQRPLLDNVWLTS